jgi:heat shock protein HslJ
MHSARGAVSVAAATGLLLCAVALSGCAGIRANGGPQPAPSISGQWVLVSGKDGSAAITPASTNVTLLIKGASSGGNGGCNAFGARASGSTTGPLTITLGIHTNMACVGDDRNITEQQYFDALGKVTTAALSGSKLTLTGPAVTLTFDRSGS